MVSIMVILGFLLVKNSWLNISVVVSEYSWKFMNFRVVLS